MRCQNRVMVARNESKVVTTTLRKEQTLDALLITPEEKARRQKAIDTARRSIRLEGMKVDPEGEALFDRYIAGELSRPELDAAVLALANRLG